MAKLCPDDCPKPRPTVADLVSLLHLDSLNAQVGEARVPVLDKLGSLVGFLVVDLTEGEGPWPQWLELFDLSDTNQLPDLGIGVRRIQRRW